MVSLNCAIMPDFSCRIGNECKAHCGDLRWAEYIFVIEESVCLIRAICLRLQMSLSPLLLSTSTIVRWPYLKRINYFKVLLPSRYTSSSSSSSFVYISARTQFGVYIYQPIKPQTACAFNILFDTGLCE